jgi:hypothetical protein
MKWLFLLLGLLLLLTLLTVSNCQDDLDNDEPALRDDSTDDEDSPAEHVASDQEVEKEQTEAEGISTICIFPSHPLGQFPAGSSVEALIGFKNSNENLFHLEYVRGSLTSPTDFTYYIYNFSGSVYNTTVTTGGEEVSLLYRFQPDPSLEPRQYGLILQIFYTNDDNVTFLSTIYNGTIDVTESLANVDGKTIFATLSIAGIVGFAGFMGFKFIQKRGTKKKSNKSASKEKTAAEAVANPAHENVDWEYVSLEHQQFVAKKKSGSPTPSPPKTRNSPARSR